MGEQESKCLLLQLVTKAIKKNHKLYAFKKTYFYAKARCFGKLDLL